MLEVVKRKQDLVEKTYCRGGSLFLETQKGASAAEAPERFYCAYQLYAEG